MLEPTRRCFRPLAFAVRGLCVAALALSVNACDDDSDDSPRNAARLRDGSLPGFEFPDDDRDDDPDAGAGSLCDEVGAFSRRCLEAACEIEGIEELVTLESLFAAECASGAFIGAELDQGQAEAMLQRSDCEDPWITNLADLVGLECDFDVPAPGDPDAGILDVDPSIPVAPLCEEFALWVAVCMQMDCQVLGEIQEPLFTWLSSECIDWVSNGQLTVRELQTAVAHGACDAPLIVEVSSGLMQPRALAPDVSLRSVCQAGVPLTVETCTSACGRISDCTAPGRFNGGALADADECIFRCASDNAPEISNAAWACLGALSPQGLCTELDACLVDDP
ncbi:MAG: hypothetical protein ACE366_05410 [Bradymonadia bacterium]